VKIDMAAFYHDLPPRTNQPTGEGRRPGDTDPARPDPQPFRKQAVGTARRPSKRGLATGSDP